MQTALVVLVLAQLAAQEPPPISGWPLVDAGRCLDDSALPDHDMMRPSLSAGAVRMRDGCDAGARPRLRDTPPQHGSEDEWFAVDKVQHFAMAYGTAMFGYGVLRGAGASHDNAQAAALAGSLAAGIGKEVFDRARGGPFSLKDLTWDALGTLAAWGLLSLNR